MKINTRETQGVTIVDVAGDMPIGDRTLLEQVKELLAASKRQILVNLANVTHMSDFGLGHLVSSWVSCRKQGGDLRLLNPRGQVQEFLKDSKLIAVFQIYATEDEALRSFESGQEG